MYFISDNFAYKTKRGIFELRAYTTDLFSYSILLTQGHPYFTPLPCSIQCLPDIVKGNCHCQLIHGQDSFQIRSISTTDLFPHSILMSQVCLQFTPLSCCLPLWSLKKSRKLNLNSLLATFRILFKINLVPRYQNTKKLHCSCPNFFNIFQPKNAKVTYFQHTSTLHVYRCSVVHSNTGHVYYFLGSSSDHISHNSWTEQ